MDKDLEKILRDSKKGDPVKKPEAAPKLFPKNKPYDYLVFTKLVRFSGFQKLIFLVLFPLAMAIGFLFPDFYREVLYSYAVYATLIILYLVFNKARYHFRFKGWQERLPFALEGWNEIIHEKKMFCDLCWNHARMEVITTDRDPQLMDLVEAALKIFCKRSQMAFYTQRMGSSAKYSRNDWKVKAKTNAEGSMNPEVMGYMKDVLEKQLSTIARKTGKITAVKVSLLSEEFEVQIEIRNGE